MTVSFACQARKTVVQEPDIIICRDYLSALAGLEIKRKFPNSRLVMDVCEYPNYSGRSSIHIRNVYWSVKLLFKYWHKKFLHQADLVFSICEACSGRITDYNSSKIRLFRNYKESFEKRSDKKNLKKFGFSENDTVIVCPGQPGALTGAIESVETLNLLPRNFKLLIIGNTSDKGFLPVLKSKIAALDLQGRVVVSNALPNKEYHKIINACDLALILFDISVLQLKYITPNRFLDCVAAKIPIIATGNIEIIETIEKYSNGKIIDSRKPENVRDEITSMLNENNRVRPEYTKRLDIVAEDFNELRKLDEKNFIESIGGLVDNFGNPLRTLILARSDISKNLRYINMIDLLSDNKNKVEVVSIRNEINLNKLKNSSNVNLAKIDVS